MSAEPCVGCGRDADVLSDDAHPLCAKCAMALLPESVSAAERDDAEAQAGYRSDRAAASDREVSL